MSDRMSIGGLEVEITDRNFGAGGQGEAFRGHLADDPGVELVVKSLPCDADARSRAEGLADLTLPIRSPGLAGPLAVQAIGDRLYHVSPLAKGQDLENDLPRTFPERLEVAHCFACQICILEERRLAHGDHAPNNVMVEPNGAVTLIDFDNLRLDDSARPPPAMAGQPMMLAPEVRRGKSKVTIESDRFAIAVMLNMILLGRHPASDLANTPAELARAMSTGRWPERDRQLQAGETPIAALGPDLPPLFDAAFSIDPTQRSAADQWRRALHAALQNTWIHHCGDAFVGEPQQTACPHCNQSISIRAHAIPLVILIPGARTRLRAPLRDDETIALGRASLPGMAGAVSWRHLIITRSGDQLLLRNVGRNGTLIEHGGQWWKLREAWIAADQLRTGGVALRLANTGVELREG